MAALPFPQYLVLCLADHGLAAIEAERHGRPQTSYVRCLNTTGRWAIHGTSQSPLLVWPSSQTSAASEAAARASKSRKRLIQVVTRGQSDWIEGHNIRLFTTVNEAMLHEFEAQSSAKARRLRTEADKLEAFCLIARAAATAADHDAFTEVSRAAAKAPRAKFGGGSITSAFAWLAGRAGREAVESVLAGEVELAGPLTIREVVDAVASATNADQLRRHNEGLL